MVKVSNGVQIFTIPEGAVKSFAVAGFTPVVKKTRAPKSEPDVDPYAELLSKPITQWSQDEVKDFAAAKGWDVSAAKSLKEARHIIKQNLDAEQEA